MTFKVSSGLAEQITEYISDKIIRMEIKPGERVLEINIAKELGVSRSPITEALRILEKTRLVELIPRKGARVTEMSENFIEQLIYLNNQLKILINKLLDNSDNLPIIILQSDEGTFPQRYRKKWKDFNWKEATELELKQKMGILNAFYLPGIEHINIYDTITPVNNFRLILNSYFKANYEILDDKNYAYNEEKNPYRFFDVTNIVNKKTILPDVNKDKVF